MFSLPSFSSAEIPAISAILLSTIAICLYLVLWDSKKIAAFIKQKWPGDKGEIRYTLTLKYTGLILLGVIPCAAFLALNPGYTLGMLGLSLNVFNTPTIYATAILGPASLMFTWFSCRNQETFDHYPNIRIVNWDTKLLIKYILSWVIYMFGYEFLFRGLLFLSLNKSFGFFTATAITTMLYAASHLVKGTKQTIGCFIYGPLLCAITWNTQSVYAAWIIHSCLTIGNSMAALMHHPTYNYKGLLRKNQKKTLSLS